MKPQLRIIQLFLEAAIPILGYLFWDWSVYFILLFYILDMFADYIITHLKSNKILKAQGGEKSDWIKWGIFGLLTFALAISMMHLAVYAMSPQIDFTKEVLAFWSFKELGLEQGYVLFPLVFFAAFQQYKMEFLMPGRFRTVHLKALWLSKMTAFVIITAFSGIITAVSQFYVFHDAFYVFGMVVLVGFYQYRARR
jgi:hypothetical protein